jgi:hypothetical protein
MWLRVLENPVFILCVMWEASVLFRQLPAWQEGSALGWMTKESLIYFWEGKVSSHLLRIQTTSKVSPALPPIQTALRVKRLGQKATSARVKIMWSWVQYICSPLEPHCVVLCQLIVMPTAQTVVWTIRGGLLSKVMYLFTGNSNKTPFLVVKGNHVVIFCAQLCGTSVTADWGRRWGKNTVLSAIVQFILVRCHYRWAYCLHLLPWWNQRILWSIGTILPNYMPLHIRRL